MTDIDWKARAEAAEAELARLRAPVSIGNHIRFSPAEDGTGNAVICPDEPDDGCYWTLIGSGPNADQNRIAQAICDKLNERLRAPVGDDMKYEGMEAADSNIGLVDAGKVYRAMIAAGDTSHD